MKRGGIVAGIAVAACLCSYRVSADSVTLSPEQTVALFGSTIGGTFSGVGSESAAREITFHYAYPLKTVGNQNFGGGFAGRNPYVANQYVNDIESMNGCVYIAQESDWGGGSFPTCIADAPVSSPTDAVTCNLRLNMSVNIGSHTEYTQYFAWSSGSWNYNSQTSGSSSNLPPYQACPWTTWHDVPVGQNTLLTSGFALASRGSSPQGQYVRCGFGTLPLYSWDGISALDESQTANFAFHRVFTTTETTGYACNRINLGVQVLQQVHYNGYYNPPTGDIWLIVGCPTITDWTPPPTTTVQTTRAPIGTGQTGITGIGTRQTDIDLNSISTDLAEIIKNQRWQIEQLDINNNNLNIIANNTAEIINILDKIYEKMVQNGELPVDDSSPSFAAIESALGAYTTARIPEQAESGITFFAVLLGYINELGWIAGIGGFSLCMSLTAWILFRGRNA